MPQPKFSRKPFECRHAPSCTRRAVALYIALFLGVVTCADPGLSTTNSYLRTQSAEIRTANHHLPLAGTIEVNKGVGSGPAQGSGGTHFPRLCGAERLMWNAQVLLNAINFCYQPSHSSMGWYLKLRRAKNGNTLSNETFVLEKRSWDEAPVDHMSCKEKYGLGPNARRIADWVHSHFGGPFDEGDWYTVSASHLEDFLDNHVYDFPWGKEYRHHHNSTVQRIPCNAEPQPDTDTCPTIMRSVLGRAHKDYALQSVDAPVGDLPRFFVYDLPGDLSSDAVLAPRHGGDSFVRLEEQLHHTMLRTPLRTMDPELADLFYVPLYPVSTCLRLKNDCKAWNSAPHCAGCRVAMKYIEESAAFVAAQGYFTNDTGLASYAGPTHMMPFIYDYGRCMETFSRDAIEKGFPAVLRNTIAVGPLGSKHAGCYIPGSDIVIAPYVSEESAGFLEVQAKLRRFKKKKKLFAFFRGDLNEGPDGAFRNLLVDVVRNATQRVGENNLFAEKRVAASKHFEDIGRSTFCLCPPGFSTWSYRLIESVLGGCIPVIFAPEGELQSFEGLNMLNYSSFGVKIHPTDVRTTMEVLRRIPAAQIRIMQLQLARVAPLLSYHRCARHMFVEASARRAGLRMRLKRTEATAAASTPPPPQPPVLPPQPSFDVDVVFTWVNGSSAAHQHASHEARRTMWLQGRALLLSDDALSENRFVDHNELRFAMRSVFMNAPWVRKIFVVTCTDQVPSWLREVAEVGGMAGLLGMHQDGPQVEIVHHASIFPLDEQSALPTFNSNAIETFLHHITGLAEQWVLMNDDCFFGKPLTKLDLFASDGRPKVSFQFNWGQISKEEPMGAQRGMGYIWATYNGDRLLDQAYKTEPRYRLMHQAIPMTKTLMQLAHQRFPLPTRTTGLRRFRTLNDVQTWYLAAWIGIYEHLAVKQRPQDHRPNMLVNMREKNVLNWFSLSKLLSPCSPSIQKSICQKSEFHSCGPAKSPADRFVYDSAAHECRGPMRTVDGFQTLKTLKECTEQCIHRGAPADTLASPAEGPFTFFCVGDMSSTTSPEVVEKLTSLMLSFFCTYFTTQPPWEKQNVCLQVPPFN